jgi:hypothetical protein
MNRYQWFDAVVMPSIKSGLKGKRAEAVLQFWNKFSDDHEEDFEKMVDITIFAPSLCTAGLATESFKGRFIYLSPTLEFESLPFIVHTVAHEFAHHFLGHVAADGNPLDVSLPHAERPHEIEANQRATFWGFPNATNSQRFYKIVLDFWRKGKHGKRATAWMAQTLDLEVKG